jgi:hypothetical protein
MTIFFFALDARLRHSESKDDRLKTISEAQASLFLMETVAQKKAERKLRSSFAGARRFLRC